MRTFCHPSGQEQKLVVADLTKDGAGLFTKAIGTGRSTVVYSDPPWNPGNEKYWRRFAKLEPPTAYDELLRGWCACVVAAAPQHIFVEQSVIPKHKQMLLDAIAIAPGWKLPLLEEWVCIYGSPKRPNALLHFGLERLTTDPTGMSGLEMVRTVIRGLPILSGDLRRQPGVKSPRPVLSDPCMGLGTTSRIAHEFGFDCVGTELNTARLDRTIGNLLKLGYVES